MPRTQQQPDDEADASRPAPRGGWVGAAEAAVSSAVKTNESLQRWLLLGFAGFTLALAGYQTLTIDKSIQQQTVTLQQQNVTLERLAQAVDRLDHRHRE